MPQSPSGHPLDRPVWSALAGPQAAFAQGGALARRLPAAIGPFADTADDSADAMGALAGLMAPGDRVAIFAPDPVPAAALTVLMVRPVEQMVGEAVPAPDSALAGQLVELGAADAPDMLALVALAKPGPFGTRTHELGGYRGLREAGRLIGMAGERLRLDGFTEISAVCTHPDHRGRGYGRTLLLAASQAIVAAGSVPFLHAFSDNPSAIALYRRCGYVTRRTLHVSILQRPG